MACWSLSLFLIELQLFEMAFLWAISQMTHSPSFPWMYWHLETRIMGEGQVLGSEFWILPSQVVSLNTVATGLAVPRNSTILRNAHVLVFICVESPNLSLRSVGPETKAPNSSGAVICVVVMNGDAGSWALKGRSLTLSFECSGGANVPPRIKISLGVQAHALETKCELEWAEIT